MEERQDHATRTISIVMIIALVGKVLGLYRDHLLAVYYGHRHFWRLMCLEAV